MVAKSDTSQPFIASGAASEDARLLIACRQGDEMAWRALLERYERLICAVPRRAGLPEDSVNEVFQEVVLSLLEKMHDIEQPERLRAWLVTSAKYKTWRVYERNRAAGKVWDTTLDQDALAVIPDTMPWPDEMLQELEEQHLLRVAFANLEERCRKLLTMLFHETVPRPYQEVAAALGVAPTSISPLRARCLKRLQRLLVK